jgi:hypothetical protein
VNSIDQRSQIPESPYYVLCNDTFMSGWGHAQGLINTLILTCDSWEQARKVEDYIMTRKDQRYIRIVSNKPRLRAGHLYQVKTPADYPRWYGIK